MNHKRQHASPVHLSGIQSDSSARVLTPISLISSENDVEKYDEDWLQKLIFEHPQLLPVEEIEPAFFPIYPVCMELPTPAGYLDNLYVSENGALTLVECKLWRNPQARREVVGQVLDYAKELSKWSYEDLDQALGSGSSRNRLFQAVADQVENLDEARFVDAVSKNLRKGRFLLLIVGDGIREGVENIANFLQAHAGLDFTFGLVELALFQMPEDGGIIVQPRTIAQTYSVERAVITLESEAIQVTPPKDQQVTHKQAGKRTTISEDQFYEEIEANSPGLSAGLKSFVEELAEFDIFPTFGSSSLNLHWSPEGTYKINFGSIRKDGLVNTEVVGWGPDHIGHIEISYEYLQELADLIPGSEIRKYESRMRKLYQDGSEIHLSRLLAVREGWKNAIRLMMRKIMNVRS